MFTTRTMMCAITAAAVLVLSAGCGQSDMVRKRELAKERWEASRAEISTRLAEGAFQRGEFGRARQHVEEVIKSGAMYAPAYALAARLAAEKGELDKASEYATTATRIDPDSAEAHYVLGTVEQQLGHAGLALEEYTVAAELSRMEAKYVLAQAEMQVAASQTEEALRNLQEAANRLPGKADLHTALGDVQSLLGRSGEAVGHYRMALRLSPGQPGLKERLATALYKSGSYSEAEPMLAELTATETAHASWWLVQMRVTSLMAMGRTPEARTLCQEEVSVQTETVGPLVMLAQCDVQENKPAQARRWLEAALAREPLHPEANALMGYVLVDAGRLDEARTHLAVAMRDPALAGNKTLARLLAKAEGRPWVEAPPSGMPPVDGPRTDGMHSNVIRTDTSRTDAVQSDVKPARKVDGAAGWTTAAPIRQ
jgi:Tfp pilus assembly protein PilF